MKLREMVKDMLGKKGKEELKPITLPLVPEDYERIQKHYDKKAKEAGGDNYVANKNAKKYSRTGMVKVLGRFYNPLQGKNTPQFRWVVQKNISQSKEFKAYLEYQESLKKKGGKK